MFYIKCKKEKKRLFSFPNKEHNTKNRPKGRKALPPAGMELTRSVCS